MLNENASNLKAHLATLHQNLSATGEVDEETQALLRQLDSDIQQVLARRSAAADAADPQVYGLASRAQELTAEFAVRHPRLEPALRQLGDMLASMGI